MPAAPTGHVLVASMAPSPRSVQRVVTAIAGCGFSIDSLQYRHVGKRRAMLVATLDSLLASRDLQHLCAVVDGTIGVYWAQPIQALVSGGEPPGGFRIAGYEVAASHANGQTRMQARAALMIDGRRHLGAGEGTDGTDALVRAVEAAVHLAGNWGEPTFAVSCRWSNPSVGTPALVVAEVQHANGTGSAVGAGHDDLEATARALEGLRVRREP